MQNLRSLYQKNSKALAQGWRWWTGELSEIFDAFNASRKTNRIQFDISKEDGVNLNPDTKNKNLKGLQNLTLKFNDNSMQFRKIKLPAAAAKNIDKVVKYEFGKYFPMNVADALISSTVVPSTVNSESIEVEIWAISKKLITHYLAHILETYGIEAKLITIINQHDQVVISHDAAELQSKISRRKKSFTSILLNFNLIIMLMALLIYPVYKMDLYLQQLKDGVSLLEQDAKPVIETRNKILEKERRLLSLIKIKQENPNQAYIWSQVTGLMTDRVTLDKMEINGNDVKLEGKAPSAEKVIKILEEDRAISNVKIIGSVNSTSTGQQESLNVSMTIKPQSEH